MDEVKKEDMTKSRADRRREQRQVARDASKLDAVIMQRASDMAYSATLLLMMGISVDVLHEAINNAYAEYLKEKPSIEAAYYKGVPNAK